MSNFKSVFNSAAYKKYMDKRNKEKKKVKDKHYSSFWWDESWGSASNRFAGLNDNAPASADVVKLIKLTGYQRAIANFVKIVTKKDIPVVFSGNESYTNGKRVNLSTDISDKNFDVVVGLALHEASHIKMTDFEYVSDYIKLRPSSNRECDEMFKTIVNVIEDRRIDNYIFKSSPGYRAYYHKMYDHYFNGKTVGKGLRSSRLRTLTIPNYMFHLVNMTNPFFDPKALPGLKEVVDMIDISTIGRLGSSKEVIALAEEVYSTIIKHIETASSGQVNNNGNPNDNSQGESNKPNNGNKEQSTDDSTDSMSVQADDSQEDGDESGSSESLIELTPQEERDIQKEWQKQKEFLVGDVAKKTATKKLQDQLEQVSKMELDVQQLGDAKSKSYYTIIYDFVHKTYVKNRLVLLDEYKRAKSDKERNEIAKKAGIKNTAWGMSTRALELPNFLTYGNPDAVEKGFELGGVLGRKLQVRNEERSLVYNRLKTGSIDSKRLSHAGHGIETIFKQIHIDKYKQACLHISLDLSGSMGGSKWHETVLMTSAIAKAATYVQNLRIQVSLRTTEDSGRRSQLPVLINVYDSKFNDLHHFKLFMSNVGPYGCTPEGLCFEAMLKRNMLMPSNSEYTSYFLNISDGEPGMANYDGYFAVQHTARQVRNLINNLGIGVLSFYVESHRTSTNEPSARFVEMYGKDSRKVAAENMHQIARELNSKFLQEGKYTG